MSSEGWASLAYPPSQEDVEAGKDSGTPNDAQLAFLALTTFVQVFVAGFGAGKTTTGALKALIHMLANPGSRGAAVGPTYRHTRNQYRAIMALLERIKLRDGVDLVRKAKTSQAESIIELTNGSTVEFFSAAGKAGLYGWDGAWVWLDELEWFDSPESYYSDVQTRVRQVSDPGLADIHYRTIYITSTAQYSVGILKDKLEEAEAQARAYTAGERTEPPTIGAVVCPSTVAVGHGLTLDRIETWASEMEPGSFLRGVMCILRPPPEVVYADYVSDRHLIDWSYVAECPSYYLLDWGIRPHWIHAQYSEQHQALILADEWGLDDTPTREFVQSMVAHAQAHGLADKQTGRPIRRFGVFGDPTPDTNMSRAGLKADSQAYLQEDGRRVLREYGWPFVSPQDPRRRAKWLQIQLLRSLLKPGGKGRPRILISKRLADKRDKVTRHKYTRRGIYHALTEGVRFPRDKRSGLIREGAPVKDGVFEHAYDALCFGTVMIFNAEFDRLCSLDHGRLSGAGAW